MACDQLNGYGEAWACAGLQDAVRGVHRRVRTQETWLKLPTIKDLSGCVSVLHTCTWIVNMLQLQEPNIWCGWGHRARLGLPLEDGCGRDLAWDVLQASHRKRRGRQQCMLLAVCMHRGHAAVAAQRHIMLERSQLMMAG